MFDPGLVLRGGQDSNIQRVYIIHYLMLESLWQENCNAIPLPLHIVLRLNLPALHGYHFHYHPID